MKLPNGYGNEKQIGCAEQTLQQVEKMFTTFTVWFSRRSTNYTYNINLFDYNIRRRYDISNIPNIPQYNYGYHHELKLKQHPKALVVQDIIKQPKITGFTHYIISKKDRNILNEPDGFLRRTLPPDDGTISTITVNFYVTTGESAATIIYPPIPGAWLVRVDLHHIIHNTGPLKDVSFYTWQNLRIVSGVIKEKIRMNQKIVDLTIFLV